MAQFCWPLTTSNDKRIHPRLIHRAPALVIIPASGKTERLQMQDFSAGGVFINCFNETLPQISDEIQIQTLEIEDAPVLDVKVVSVIPQKGFAVEFM